MQKLIRPAITLGVAVLTLFLGRPAFAFRAVPDGSRVVMAPQQAGVYEPDAPVAISSNKATFVAARQDLKVKWDARRGVPSLVTGANLLTGVAPAKVGMGVAAAPGLGQQAVSVMGALAPLYGVREATGEFEPQAAVVSASGFRHVRLNQKYLGLPVVGGQMVVHFDEKGAARMVNGVYRPAVKVDPTPALTGAQAVAAAMADQSGMGKKRGTVTSGPTLVVYARDVAPTLAYQLVISYKDDGQGDVGRWRYWVDARTGVVIKRFNDIPRAVAPPSGAGLPTAVAGSVLTGEGGGVANVTGWSQSGNYYLWHSTNRWYVFNAGGGSHSSDPDAFDYAWRPSADWDVSDRGAMSTASGFQSIQAYYRTVHGRNSFDGDGAMARANIHFSSSYVNAYYNGDDFTFGDGDGVTASELCVLDVAAHEFQHGVTDYSAGLIYDYTESGALNESFSDIFGALNEFHAQPDGRTNYPNRVPGTADWLMGEDCWLESTALRDMRNPANSATVGAGGRQPTRYRGSYWSAYGEMHQNDSVQNFFFYLLCEGGSGVNDGVISYFVPGIGIPAAEKIAYLALTGYMTPDADYAAAREAWTAAAQETDVAGITTNATLPVMLAWSAVGVGTTELVLPSHSFVSGGEPASPPFLPSNMVYTVVNPTTTNLTWLITSGGSSWLVLSSSSVTLAPQSYGSVELSIDQTVAAALPEGTYLETVVFTNSLGQGTTTRQVVLRIGQNYSMRSATYEWVDPIASLHTAVNVGSGVSGAYPIPFPVMYYGTIFSNIYISASGLAGFVPQGMESGQNVDLPGGTSPNGMLCALWDNIDGKRLPGKVYYHVDPVSSTPNRRLIITWLNVPHVDDFNATFSFQIVIPENTLTGVNNNILFQYKDVAESRPDVGSGQSATIGIEDEYGALSKKFSFDGEMWLANETALLFSQLPPPDVTAPVGTIRALGGARSNVMFEVKFNEAVTGLTASAIAFSTTVPGAGLGEIQGGGMRYLIEVTNVTSVGRIQMGVGAGAVRDLAGNANAAFGPAIYVVPVRSVNYTDNMENGPALWTASGQDFELYTTKAWAWGVPDFVDGPASAHSGSNCWGTVLTNDYPNGMNAWVMSSYIDVGAHPVLDFWVWYDLEIEAEINYDFGYVEVDNGSGWQNVTPGGFFGGVSGGWVHQSIELDNDLFSNRLIRVRFRATSDLIVTRPGMYVDDLEVSSQREPGLWVVSYTPTNSPPASNVSLYLTVYNSTTNTYGGVNGTLASPDAGVSFTGIIPVAYGTVAPGALVTNAVPAQMTLGAMGNFDLPTVQLFHQARAGGTVLSQETLLFGIDGIGSYTATNRLVATVSAPVVDWLGRSLSGNGDSQSCLYQVIYAGSNGVIDPPLVSGQVTGDDRLLYGSGLRQPWGRFGEGGMPVGQFMKSFDHALTSGVKIYVRAWDAPSFDGAVAYGDSALLTLSAAAVQTNIFSSWVVGIPVNTNRDSNGDSIPDGYCVLNGMDPRDPIVALSSSWSFADDPIGSGSTSLTPVPGQFKSTPPNPTRLFYKGDYLYVLDTAYNRLQVWNRYTRTYLRSYGSQGSVPGQFKRPMGLALDPRAGTNRFAVVDQLNFRVQVFSYNPDTGSDITFLFEFGSYGTETDQFENPTDVAMAPDGRIYVTDIRNVSNQDRSVVQVFNEDGTYSSTLATWGTNVMQVTKPWGVCVGPDGMVVVADTENNRVQAWDAAGTFLWAQPDGGSNGVTLFRPRDAEIGLDGRVYVADTDNSRIVIYRSDGSYVATLGTLGGGLDQDLRYPYAVAPVVESNIVYVADSYHYRVVALAAIYDGDGDGMDDIWEELHGLDPNDPTDGLVDSNGNGFLNIGDYRLNQDPQGPGAPVRITAFSLNPSVLRWETVSTGGIYRIEYSCDSLRMASNSWIYGSVVTSPVVGSLAVTNMLTMTNRVEYFRVKRIGP